MVSFGFAIFIGKITKLLIHISGKGAGATWPGEIALRLRPEILGEMFTKVREQKKGSIILIVGTNGKTTTAKMLATILTKQKKRVIRNDSGANLDNGLISTFLSHATYFGTLKRSNYIFEVDEATLPVVLRQGVPDCIIFMNLFRDQLDRYGEVDAVAEKWLNALKELPISVSLLFNGDDPHLAYIGRETERRRNRQKMISQNQSQRHVLYFGLENPEYFLPKMQHATDSIFCPDCGNRLTFGGVYFSHLGKYACGQCGFTHPAVSMQAKDIQSPIPGVYNIYNTLAAVLAAHIMGITKQDAHAALVGFQPAFGRMECVEYQGKTVRILLSKNPTGFNESLRTVLASKTSGPFLLLLNDRIPDGTDISWIYDVDFELLSQTERTIFVSGDRCYDLAARLQYAGVPQEQLLVVEKISDAVDKSVEMVEEGEQLWILPTYSAMLDVREVITGKRIL